MSVPEYSAVLNQLQGCVGPAISAVEVGLGAKTVPRGEYRELVARRCVVLAKGVIGSLPVESRHGAAVTLRDYGTRNLDSMVDRILAGVYAEVEDSYSVRERRSTEEPERG